MTSLSSRSLRNNLACGSGDEDDDYDEDDDDGDILCMFCIGIKL